MTTATTTRTWTYVEPWAAQDPATWEGAGVNPFLRERELLIDVEIDGPARHCLTCGGRVVLIRYTWRPVEDSADAAAAQRPVCKCTSWRHADGSPSHGAFAADLCPRPYCEGCDADVGAGHCPTCHTDGTLSRQPSACMSAFCADLLPHLCGAIGPELVWDGAQARGLTIQELNRLAVVDRLAENEVDRGDGWFTPTIVIVTRRDGDVRYFELGEKIAIMGPWKTA